MPKQFGEYNGLLGINLLYALSHKQTPLGQSDLSRKCIYSLYVSANKQKYKTKQKKFKSENKTHTIKTTKTKPKILQHQQQTTGLSRSCTADLSIRKYLVMFRLSFTK